MRKMYVLPYIGWRIIVWFGTDCYDADNVGTDLIKCGARGNAYKELMSALWEKNSNQGITFVNERSKMALVAIGKASDSSEYANTIAHEIGHLSVMLADAEGINLRSENFTYLIGDLTQMIWKDSHKLTCPKCSCNK